MMLAKPPIHLLSFFSCLSWTLALVVTGAVTTAGCGGDGPTAIPFADLEAKVKDVACANSVRCGAYPDQAICLASVGIQFAQLQADVASGITKYDGKAAANCLEAIGDPQGSGSCSRSARSAAILPTTCDGILTGTVATGGECIVDEECVSGGCDLAGCMATTCCRGVCSPAPPVEVPVGGDCSTPGARCVDQAFCKRTGTTAICTGHTAMGGPCADVEECTPGLACLRGAAMVGTCEPLPKQGEACPFLSCDSSFDRCDVATNTCVAKVAVGDPCPSGGGCVDFAFCDAAHTCVGRGGPRAACVDSSMCLVGLVCSPTTSTCTVPESRPPCP